MLKSIQDAVPWEMPSVTPILSDLFPIYRENNRTFLPELLWKFIEDIHRKYLVWWFIYSTQYTLYTVHLYTIYTPYGVDDDYDDWGRETETCRYDWIQDSKWYHHLLSLSCSLHFNFFKWRTICSQLALCVSLICCASLHYPCGRKSQDMNWMTT